MADKDEKAEAPKEPTADEAHEAQLATDHRGRACSMFDFITRTANPSEMEEVCDLLQPLFERLTKKM